MATGLPTRYTEYNKFVDSTGNSNMLERPLRTAPSTTDTEYARFVEQPGSSQYPGMSEDPYSNFLNSLFASTGMSPEPAPGYLKVGADNTGNNIFSSEAAANSTNTRAGTDYTNAFLEMIKPFKILNDKEASNWEKLSGVTQDAGFLASLGVAVANKSPKQFVNTFLAQYGTDIPKILSEDPKKQNQYSALLGAYTLYNRWDSLSPLQKGIGLARTGIEANLGITGTDWSKQPIPGTVGGFGGKGLSVGDGLGLLDLGVNAYSLAKNWKQMDAFSKILNGTSTVSQTAYYAQKLGLLGNGVNGAAVSITPSALSSAGAVSAPAYGIGAISVPTAGAIPNGYTAVASGIEGKVIAVPTPNVGSSALGQGGMANSGITFQNVGGVAAIALGAHQIIKGWGTGGAAGRLNSTMGGSSIAAGMYALGATNPFLLGGVVAASFLMGSIKTGKQEDQVKRDAVRSSFRKAGLVGEDYTIKFADGSVSDIGIDGSKNQIYEPKNPDKVVGGYKGRKSGAYDVDYTNDLDYFSGTAGITLSRLVNGGKATNIDQLGGQLGNGALGKVGRGADFNPDNFNAVMQNQRSMYAQAGVKSKAEGYALVNTMLHDGRLDDTDAVSMQQSLNMVFDSDFNTAQKLNAGRWNGIKEADKANQEEAGNTQPQQKPSTIEVPQVGGQGKPTTVETSSIKPIAKTPTQPMPATKDEAIARNRSRSGLFGGATLQPQEASGGA